MASKRNKDPAVTTPNYQPENSIPIKIVESPKMKVNFKAASSEYTPREKGEYEGTLIGHKINMASGTSGNPTINLEWSENDSPNRRMFKTYSLQPKALWSLKRDLIRMGASVEAMNDEDADLDEIVQSLYGYTSTLVYGDPRPYTAKDGTEKVGDAFLEIKDPSK